MLNNGEKAANLADEYHVVADEYHVVADEYHVVADEYHVGKSTISDINKFKDKMSNSVLIYKSHAIVQYQQYFSP